MTTTLAFLGLGVMGGPMAGHLAKAGHHTRVWNRTTDRARVWAQVNPGEAHDTVEETVADVDAVLMCVGNDHDVREVAHRAIRVMAKGAILIDHTTASAEVARELDAACTKVGLMFVDAPVSGGQAGAESGQLTIMCGGADTAYAKAEPIMNAYAKAMTHMGPAGAGQLTKMVNQLCIAGVLQGLSEGVHFAQTAGLDVDKVFAAIGQGAAQSWQMDNRAATMACGEFNFGFAVDWMRKDLAIALDEARSNGAKLPLAALVDQFYADIQAMGGGRWDTSSLVKRLTARA